MVLTGLGRLLLMPELINPVMIKIITRIKPKMALDLIVRTSEQVKERLAMQDNFMQEIIKQGKVAYEANHA